MYFHKYRGITQHTIITSQFLQCQESGHSLTGSSVSESHKASIKGSDGCSLSEAYMGKDLLPRLLGIILLLEGCQTGGLSFLLAVSQSCPSVPCHVALSIGQITIWKVTSSKPAREGVSQEDRHYSLIWCNHEHVFTCIWMSLLYSIRSKS